MVVANDAAQPLTSATATANAASSVLPLYDPACIILMDKQLARGYITLLSGKAPPIPEQPSFLQSSSKTKNTIEHVAEDAVTLGFIAVTDGNVIEACFGIKQQQQRQKVDKNYNNNNNHAHKTVQKVKELLREASYVSDAIPQLAVEAYWNAFGIVLSLHEQVDKLNFVTRCLFYPCLVKKALDDLKAAFGPLEEALRDST
jgi:hypothetical protein